MTTIIFPSCPKEIQDEIVEYKKDKSLKNYVLKQAQFYFHKINIVHQNLKLIISENEKQSEIISKLKQAILQEASAGQLTAEWRTQNPMQKGNPDTDAAALLAKIKAEKQQLIAEGKLKKEKPLPEISPDEIPFSLPDSWVWCRLVEIAEGFEYGSSSKSLKSGKVPVLRMGNLQNGLVDLTDLVYTNEEKEIEQYALFYGDLLFNRTNSRELVGKTSLFLYDKKMIYAGYLVRYRMLGSISFQYTNYVMNSQLHRDWCHTIKVDAIGQSNINATKLRSFCFPLPPLAEQKAIVEKVDRLMNIIDQLEQQIKHRKQLAEDLMQTVLREAFE
jgi:type I restriction enzyme S subunit